MNRKGLYSSIIDNLFKRFKNKCLSPIHNNKKKPPSSPSSSSSKKIKTPLRSWRDTITKKKEHTLEGISISPGKNHEGRYTFQIFFERRISKVKARGGSEKLASISRSQPRGCSVKFRAAKFRSSHWRVYIHIYPLPAYCCSLSLFARTIRQSSSGSMQIPLQNHGGQKGGGGGGGGGLREKQFAGRNVSRGYRRVIFSDPVTRV